MHVSKPEDPDRPCSSLRHQQTNKAQLAGARTVALPAAAAPAAPRQYGRGEQDRRRRMATKLWITVLPAASESSRKHRKSLDLQPVRELFRAAVASRVIILTILSIILGTGLGLRLTYPLLVPLVTTGMAIVTLIGFAQGQEAWWFAVAAIVAATGLQFGYLAGALALVVFPSQRQLRVAELRVPVQSPRNERRLPPSR
jgi:hypothetical protein